MKNDSYLKGFMQEWVIKALLALIPRDEKVKIISHNLTIRTESCPEGYTVDILGVDNFGDTRIEVNKNVRGLDRENADYKVIFKDNPNHIAEMCGDCNQDKENCDCTK